MFFMKRKAREGCSGAAHALCYPDYSSPAVKYKAYFHEIKRETFFSANPHNGRGLLLCKL